MDGVSDTQKMAKESRASAHGVSLSPTWQIWRMILWREWRVNRNLILNLLGLWLVVTLVLPVFVRTTPVILTCVMLGQVLAVRLAGGDWGWGSETFSLSLPPSRGAYFWIRFLIGIVVLEVFLFVGHFGTYAHIGARLWAQFVESGTTNVVHVQDVFDPWLRAYALATGSYAVTFALAANHAGKSIFTSTWIVGLGVWLFASHLVSYALYWLVPPFGDDGRFEWYDYAHWMAIASAAIGILSAIVGSMAFGMKPADGILSKRAITVLLVLLIIGSVVGTLFLTHVTGVWESTSAVYPVIRGIISF